MERTTIDPIAAANAVTYRRLRERVEAYRRLIARLYEATAEAQRYATS